MHNATFTALHRAPRLRLASGLCLLGALLFTPAATALDDLELPAAADSTLSQDEHFSMPLDIWLKPWKGDFDGMLKRRVIRVLTTHSRTFYFVDKGAARGITHDTFMEFERQLNAKLAKEKKLDQKHLKVKVVFIPVARDELLQALNEGKGDIAAANLTITPARQALIDFTTPLQTDVSEWVLSSPKTGKLKNINALSGQQVFVRKSSSYYQTLKILNDIFKRHNLPPMELKAAPDVLEDEDLIEMLNANLVSHVVVDSHKALFWKKIFPNVHINQSIALRSNGQIAWAIRKDSPQLAAQLNRYIANNAKGSAVGNTILQRYLKNTQYIKNAGSDKERAKFISMVDYFQKYSAKYNVDWLLMTAQGYQESRLNQTVRSKVGAIGVMQVMPATGKDMKVGDIRKLEPNIHAGIKYIRWMIEHFYEDEPMSAQDKALFAFASYNAGPGRVMGLRRLAAQRGYNKNIWFGNVEYIAAEKIGAETVTYVSNIYKYYIAYRLITEQLEEKTKTLDLFTEPNKKS
ncbi:MAG: transglycosylase SLT domain-containing protein [Aeromonas sp.]